MRKANFNNSLFDNLNEKSAYILGFWYADGNIRIHKYEVDGRRYARKKFTIDNTDRQIMDDIASIIGCSYTIRRAYGNASECYKISVINDHYFDYCFNQVKSVDKTHNGAFPFIPKHLMHHFVRGLFDGDGSIFVKKYNSRHGTTMTNLASSFAASRDSWVFLDDLKQVLIENAGVSNVNISIYTSKNKSKYGNETGNSKLAFRQYDTGLLCEWMYKDATIFMKRKKKIWDDFDKTKLANSVKFFSKQRMPV